MCDLERAIYNVLRENSVNFVFGLLSEMARGIWQSLDCEPKDVQVKKIKDKIIRATIWTLQGMTPLLLFSLLTEY